MEIVMLYFLLFMFALNGILWMGLYTKISEVKSMEERIVRLLMRSKIRRVK